MRFIIVGLLIFFGVVKASKVVSSNTNLHISRFEYFFTQGLEHHLSNDSILFNNICDSLNEILTLKEYKDFRLFDSLDIKTGKIVLKFSFPSSNFNEYGTFTYRDISFYIKNRDSIYIEGNIIYEGKYNFDWYFSEWQNGSVNVSRRIDTINYFGKDTIAYGTFQFYSEVFKRKKITTEEWKVYFFYINEILNKYQILLNNISLKKLNASFNELDLVMQKTILSYRPLVIIFNNHFEYFLDVIPSSSAD